jgi:uncharacterized membrane protein
MVGDAMVGMQYFGSSFPFFFIQAVAITVEDTVIGLARRVGFDKTTYLTRAIGYIWVLLWANFSIPWLLNWQVASGQGMSEIFPVSPVRYGIRQLNETLDVDVVSYFIPSQSITFR